MPIPIQVSPHLAEPMYHQIEDQLRALILNGQLPAGTLLPSIREFAAELSCSVITIRRVYQDLENEGILGTRQGMGTYVAEVGDSRMEKYRYEAVSAALRAAVITGRRVHCTTEELRSLFEEALERELREEQERTNGEAE
ncbi:GntR family transcriptional regulator [Paenibacillus sp. N3.4]|nr:GntR family transcriptional regulator [Paenibacillus sp. N3.4]